MKNEFRLSQAVYEQLERQLPQPIVTKDTTEHQIGYMLGIQHILGILRKGFTVDETNEAREPSFRTRAR